MRGRCRPADGGPARRRTRLDAAVDACVAVAAVADVLGDRCGALAFDDAIRARVRPVAVARARSSARCSTSSRAPVDSDYELAFATWGPRKRVLVMVFTDLLDEAAARSLAAAMPVLTRRHAVIVVSALDDRIDAAAAPPRPMPEAGTPWPPPSMRWPCGAGVAT